ncbi:FUSC family protein [Streptomyces sp. NPDC059918]|uniref:FUSC family protein n=1 Tax=unclassified Streptomyces TaxID=2593676 RepID=UPI00366802EF
MHSPGPRLSAGALTPFAARAALALAAPFAVGLAAHRPEYGAIASLGALFGVLAATAPARRTRLRTVTACLLLGGAGAALGGLVQGHGWVTFAAVTGLALFSGMISSLNRVASLAGLMLLLNAVLAAGLPPSGPWWVPPLLVAGGGLLVLALCAPAGTSRTPRSEQSPADRQVPPTGLRAFLASAAPWNYGLRLALCVGLAQSLVVLMPFERGYWVPVTVVFVLKPDLGPVLSRALLRAAGTAVGLLAAVAVFAAVPRGWWEVPVLLLLGAVLPLLSARGYGAQTAVVTPVILLLSDMANLEGAELVGQLMADSLIGCAVALVAGHALWPRSRPAAADASSPGPHAPDLRTPSLVR